MTRVLSECACIKILNEVVVKAFGKAPRKPALFDAPAVPRLVLRAPIFVLAALAFIPALKE